MELTCRCSARCCSQVSNWFKNRRQRDRAAETTRDKEPDKRGYVYAAARSIQYSILKYSIKYSILFGHFATITRNTSRYYSRVSTAPQAPTLLVKHSRLRVR